MIAIESTTVRLFLKSSSIASLNKFMTYMQENEITSCLKVVAILREGMDDADQPFVHRIARQQVSMQNSRSWASG
jgi:hypothetical protein